MSTAETDWIDGAEDGTAKASSAARADASGCWIKPSSAAPFSACATAPLRHNFHQHPLMEMSELRRLAHFSAKTNRCKFLRPGADQRSAFDTGDASFDGRSRDKVFDEIEAPRTWVALFEVEQGPIGGAMVALKKRLRGYQPPPGFER